MDDRMELRSDRSWSAAAATMWDSRRRAPGALKPGIAQRKPIDGISRLRRNVPLVIASRSGIAFTV